MIDETLIDLLLDRIARRELIPARLTIRIAGMPGAILLDPYPIARLLIDADLMGGRLTDRARRVGLVVTDHLCRRGRDRQNDKRRRAEYLSHGSAFHDRSEMPCTI